MNSVWYKQAESFARKTTKEPLFGTKISSFSFKSDHVFRGPRVLAGDFQIRSNLLDRDGLFQDRIDIERDDLFERLAVTPIFPELPFRRMAKGQFGKNREWMGESRQ